MGHSCLSSLVSIDPYSLQGQLDGLVFPCKLNTSTGIGGHLCQFEPDGSFVHDAIQDGTILPSYVPTEVQLVDIFTKPYPLEKEAGL